MTDMTAAIQRPGIVGVAPVYTQCTANDSFKAAPNSRYTLHYKNGATPTGALKITDQASSAQAPAGAVLGAGWADAVTVPASIAASGEILVDIANTTRFRDGQGAVNLVHGTPTTLSVCITGPFPVS